MNEIKDYVQAQTEHRARLPNLEVGSILVWYDCKKSKPIYHSRVTALTSIGVYVDSYLPNAAVAAIPWSVIRKTRYGFSFPVIRTKEEYGYEIIQYRYPKPGVERIKYLFFRNLK